MDFHAQDPVVTRALAPMREALDLLDAIDADRPALHLQTAIDMLLRKTPPDSDSVAS